MSYFARDTSEKYHAPMPTDKHPYRPLEPGAIRMFRFEPDSTVDDIRGRLTHLRAFDTEHVPTYSALSYCWGDANDTHFITLDGRPFAVTRSLFEALRALQSKSHDKIWIDAICINQADVDERSAQVQQMWRIFVSAELVISWLGPKDEETDGIFDAAASVDKCLAKAAEHDGRVLLGLQMGDDSVGVYTPVTQVDKVAPGVVCKSKAWGQALLSFCARPYFARAWIIPEVLHARHAIVLCGDRWTTWSTFQYIIYQAQSFWNHVIPDLARALRQTPATFQAVKLCETRCMLYFLGEADNADDDPMETFFEVLDFYGLGQCADVRDRIFAFLNDPRIRKLQLLDRFCADYSMSVRNLSLVVLAQLTSFILQRDSQPGQLYDHAILIMERSLAIDLNSQAYYNWLRPQIDRIYETARTPAGNAVYMLDLRNGLNIYLDTFQLRKIRKDPDFAQYITSPADDWDNIEGCDEPIVLANVSDTAKVLPLRNANRQTTVVMFDNAEVDDPLRCAT